MRGALVVKSWTTPFSGTLFSTGCTYAKFSSWLRESLVRARGRAQTASVPGDPSENIRRSGRCKDDNDDILVTGGRALDEPRVE